MWTHSLFHRRQSHLNFFIVNLSPLNWKPTLSNRIFLIVFTWHCASWKFPSAGKPRVCFKNIREILNCNLKEIKKVKIGVNVNIFLLHTLTLELNRKSSSLTCCHSMHTFEVVECGCQNRIEILHEFAYNVPQTNQNFCILIKSVGKKTTMSQESGNNNRIPHHFPSISINEVRN